MKVELVKILSVGWTNIVYLGRSNGKKVVVKSFFNNPRVFFLLIFYVICSFLRFQIPPAFPVFPKTRLKNELSAHKTLKKLGIKVPSVKHSEKFIVKEYVEGLNMDEFLKRTESSKLIKKAAYIRGKELGIVHNNGHAFVDNKVSNFIITPDFELVSVDHEFFCRKAKEFQMELDFITLLSTVPIEIYDEFWKSFSLGYKNVRKKLPEIERKEILGWSMIAFKLMQLMGIK